MSWLKTIKGTVPHFRLKAELSWVQNLSR